MSRPTWTDLAALAIAEDAVTEAFAEPLERMASAADGNESTPIYWHSDDEVLTLLRDLASPHSVGDHRLNRMMYAGRAKALLR